MYEVVWSDGAKMFSKRSDAINFMYKLSRDGEDAKVFKRSNKRRNKYAGYEEI